MSSHATSDLKDAAKFHVPEDALLPCSELHNAAERGDVELLKMLLSRPEPEPALEVGLGKGFVAELTRQLRAHLLTETASFSHPAA